MVVHKKEPWLRYQDVERIKQQLTFTFFRFSAILAVATLLFIVGYIVIEGSSVISWTFLSQMWSHMEISTGGILQAIIGTLFLAIGVIVVSVPIGVLTAIYLNEYATDNWLTRLIRLSIRNLAGVPSIVYGMFGLALFVTLMNMGTSLIAAILTLSAMTLPWIISASEEALKSIPDSFREGSLALGATRWETVRKNVLPHASSGIITGCIVGIGRALGETAPIILVGATFFMDYLAISPFDKFMALPYHLYILATQHADPNAASYALGVALVLMVLVFALSAGAIIMRYKLRLHKQW